MKSVRSIWASTILLALVFIFTMSTYAAPTVKQVVSTDGIAMQITGWNENVKRKDLVVYEMDLRVFTPEFTEDIIVPGKISTVLVVQEGRVKEVLTTEGNKVPAAPAIPYNGFIVVGTARSSLFLSIFSVGDTIAISEKASTLQNPLPTTVATEKYGSKALTGINIGRGENGLVLYTPEYGTFSFSNEWGAEIAVADGKVVAKRRYEDRNLFPIPENGFVISGHWVNIEWLQNMEIGDVVELR